MGASVRRARRIVLALLVLAAAGATWWPASFAAPQAPARARPWRTVYYAGWSPAKVPPWALASSGATHVAHFSALPGPDGTLDLRTNGLTPDAIAAVVSAARRAGAPVLLALGGAETAPRFRAALKDDAARERLVAGLVALLAQGYAGVDLDMEPLEPADAPRYARFVRALSAALRAGEGPPRLLTAAVAVPRGPHLPALFAELAPLLDQINLMTYLPSAPPPAQFVAAFVAAGVPPEKIGVGLDRADTEATCATKAALSRTAHLGGVIVWELGAICASSRPPSCLSGLCPASAPSSR